MATRKRKATRRKNMRKKHPRTGKILTGLLYTYVEPGNLKHAKRQGKRPMYGTMSAYVNALIAKDRGVAPAMGTRGQIIRKNNTLYVQSVNRKTKVVTLTHKKPKTSQAQVAA